MIELALTIAIVAIAGVTLLRATGFLLAHQSDALGSARSSALARAYLDEIAARRYDEATPQGGIPPCSAASTPCSAPSAFDDGESRDLFDDVDDFDGISDSPPRDAAGVPLDGFDGYRVDVEVRYADATTITQLGLDDATDAKLVTVSVTPPGGSPEPFTRIHANW
jgi:MSHA pilin protein MshD